MAGDSTPDRHNILLIVSDDIGMDDIGPFGSEIKTPALELLSQQGIRFTNFHASPVCSVTRGQLLTGANTIEIGLVRFPNIHITYDHAANRS